VICEFLKGKDLIIYEILILQGFLTFKKKSIKQQSLFCKFFMQQQSLLFKNIKGSFGLYFFNI
jgi:hypothetical protein